MGGPIFQEMSSQQTTHLYKTGKWESADTINGLKVQTQIPDLAMEKAIKLHKLVVATVMNKSNRTAIWGNQYAVGEYHVPNNETRSIRWVAEEYRAVRRAHPEYDFNQTLNKLTSWARSLPNATNI